jgi:hypothetical protein
VVELTGPNGTSSVGKTMADETETESMPIAEIVRRSTLGTGCYVIRDEDIAARILDAVVRAGACAVGHDAMYDRIERGTALPGGFIYEVVLTYGFGGLPQRSWVVGARPLRHIMRLLGWTQPRHRLSGEETIPSLSELVGEWEEFAHLDLNTRIQASLAAMDRMGCWYVRIDEDGQHRIGKNTVIRDGTGRYWLSPQGDLTPWKG